MGLSIECSCGEIYFSAGSYHGYGYWRKVLAKIAGISDIEAFWRKAGSITNRKGEEPFFELLNFNDNEGSLPIEECKNLLEDFDKFSKIIHGNGQEFFWTKLFQLNLTQTDWDYFVKKFDEWHNAFRHAVATSCSLIFH